MTTRHLPISKGQYRGLLGSISMVKLVSRILRHNQWGWGHVVEICEPPNVRGQPLHHLAQKSPREGSRIAKASTAISGGVLACGAEPLHTHKLQMWSKERTTLSLPPSKIFLLWPMLGHTPSPTANPSRRLTPGRPRNCWHGWVGVMARSSH